LAVARRDALARVAVVVLREVRERWRCDAARQVFHDRGEGTELPQRALLQPGEAVAVPLHGVTPEWQGDHVRLRIDAPLRAPHDCREALLLPPLEKGALHVRDAEDVMRLVRLGLLFLRLEVGERVPAGWLAHRVVVGALAAVLVFALSVRRGPAEQALGCPALVLLVISHDVADSSAR